MSGMKLITILAALLALSMGNNTAVFEELGDSLKDLRTLFSHFTLVSIHMECVVKNVV